jgi:glycerate 2-kinase
MMNESIAAFRSAALAAVNPIAAIERDVNRSGDRLTIADRLSYDLGAWEIRCIALGKAAVPMAQAMADILGSDLASGLVVTKHAHLGTVKFPAEWEVIEAGHPTPDECSLDAGDRVENFLDNCTDRTLIIACISGGASALVTAPSAWSALGQMFSVLSPQLLELTHAALQRQDIDIDTIDPQMTIPLTVMQAINTSLLNCGLEIESINAVRSQLDRLKGGGLVARALPGQVVGLILSDVIGDSIASIASGLTNHPAAENIIIGSNHQACQAVADTAKKLGYHPQIVTTTLTGEAQVRGREIAREILTQPPKTVLIYGGETTVTLSPECQGKGGRNQELALAAAIELSTQATPAWVATLATDGTDGPTDAAGATVTERTISRAIECGLDAKLALDRHDSYRFFEKLGDLLRIGATGTNVADITIAIRP